MIKRTFLLFASPMQHDAKLRKNNSGSMMMISELSSLLTQRSHLLSLKVSAGLSLKHFMSVRTVTFDNVFNVFFFLKQLQPRPPVVT